VRCDWRGSRGFLALPRLSARLHLLGFLAAAIVPVWLFAAYLFTQYAVIERARFERGAIQVARQVSLVVESDLDNMFTVLESLAKSSELANSDFASLHAEARRLTNFTNRIILLRDVEGRQLFNTQLAYGTSLPQAVPLSDDELARVRAGQRLVSGVYADSVSGGYRIAASVPITGPGDEQWLLSITVPTNRLRDVMLPAVPDGWTVGIGDRDGSYVARSKMHEEMTGKPGLPEYIAKVIGPSGTFTARNFQGVTLLAGYYRSDFSGWFYTANIPLSVVQAPMWTSLAAIGATALLAMLVSVALAYFVGKGFTRAASRLAERAQEMGQGGRFEELTTSVREFELIADAMRAADRALSERTRELQAVLDTVPVAVWFTYDPRGRKVIRNRYAAELMGLPHHGTHFGFPEAVIDTIALQGGRSVSRDDRPLTRSMRGEETTTEEFE
jgi:hypothetical protein